jgi:arylsulfatase A-like enzyme
MFRTTFASEGMRFDRAYTTAPQCSPSRASIFTGYSPQRVCMTRLATPLAPEHKIFPEILREHGYFTGVCGRWDHVDGRVLPKQWIRGIYKRHDLQTMKRRVDFAATSGQKRAVQEMTTFFDRKPAGKPFFLQVSFNDPHRRWDADAIPDPYDPEEVPVPAYLPDTREVREDLARYYGELTRMDSYFGRVLGVLDDRGFRENTLVVFIGDNGHALPRGKGTLYQAGWHVPMLARWPGRVKPGCSTAELISGVDLPATFLEAAGIEPPKTTESRSFLNLLDGKPCEGRKYVFASRGWHGNLDLIRGVASRTHSLIYNCLPGLPYRPISDFANKPIWTSMKEAHEQGRLAPEFSKAYFSPARPVFELFDLRNDPREFNNLAGKPEYAEVEFELKSALNEWMEATYDFLPPPFVGSQDLNQNPL